MSACCFTLLRRLFRPHLRYQTPRHHDGVQDGDTAPHHHLILFDRKTGLRDSSIKEVAMARFAFPDV
jgi:hypothetical protein